MNTNHWNLITYKCTNERPWCWERLKVGGKGDDRGWHGWMASPMRWLRVWASSRSWWWTAKPGVKPGWRCDKGLRPGLPGSLGPRQLHSWGSWLPGHSVRTGSSELGEMPGNSWISLTSQEAKQKFLLSSAFFSPFKYLKEFLRDFSGSPVLKTSSFHCRGYR